MLANPKVDQFTIRELSSEQEMDFFLQQEFAASQEHYFAQTGKIPDKKYENHCQELNAYIASKPQSAIFIASHQKKPVGLVWVSVRDRNERWDFSPLPAWIYDLRVKPEYRGLGLGKRLLAQAEAWASANQLERIGLHVVGTNSIARQLYALCGYELLNCYLQKMITPQTAASVPKNQSVRFYKPQDESDYQQVFQLDFEHFHEVALSTCAIPAVQVREAYQKFMHAVNIRSEWILLAQDDEKKSVGFIWAYQSRGDLGDQEYVWLRNLQVVNQQPDLAAALLKQLES
ncbi:MAG: GNAT family N-acetyltransferase [Anaerolineales bacterium]|nr:GNAT family N-acetyltransferase [Anaerolineales bacterium]